MSAISLSFPNNAGTSSHPAKHAAAKPAEKAAVHPSHQAAPVQKGFLSAWRARVESWVERSRQRRIEHGLMPSQSVEEIESRLRDVIRAHTLSLRH